MPFHARADSAAVSTALPFLEAIIGGNEKAAFPLLASGIESGWLATPTSLAPSSGERAFPAVPRRIAQFWHDPVLPPDVLRGVESLKAHNPDCTHFLAGDESARAFIVQSYGREGGRLFDGCFHPAMRSDFWRICDLYEYGGFYVDIDTLSHAPLTPLLEKTPCTCLLTYSVGEPWCLDNDFIAATPRHPVILAVLLGLFARVDRFLKTSEFENIWVETGPGNLTMTVMGWVARKALLENTSPEETGLLFRHHNDVAESFHIIDMKYKATPEGNWRTAMPVPSSPEKS